MTDQEIREMRESIEEIVDEPIRLDREDRLENLLKQGMELVRKNTRTKPGLKGHTGENFFWLKSAEQILKEI